MVDAFWLDRDPDAAAAWIADEHLASSVFECSMVLTTAASLVGLQDDDLSFAHRNHPLTRWAAEAYNNWRYLRAYVEAAHREWRVRWNHGPEEQHACRTTAEPLDPAAVRALDWPNDTVSDPPQVTGRWKADDFVDACRHCYANEKRHLFE